MSEEFKQVEIKLVMGNVTAQYSNHIVIQHTEHEFSLYFFDLQHPLFSGAPEEIQLQIENLEFVEAHCISKIVLNPSQMKSFAESIIDNIEKYRSKFSDISTEKDKS